MNLYDTATLLYHAIDRYPARPRIDQPAPRAHVLLDGVAETTTIAGQLTLDSGTHTVTTAVLGDLATIVNKGTSGALASAQLAMASGAQAVWDPSAVTSWALASAPLVPLLTIVARSPSTAV